MNYQWITQNVNSVSIMQQHEGGGGRRRGGRYLEVSFWSLEVATLKFRKILRKAAVRGFLLSKLPCSINFNSTKKRAPLQIFF